MIYIYNGYIYIYIIDDNYSNTIDNNWYRYTYIYIYIYTYIKLMITIVI